MVSLNCDAAVASAKAPGTSLGSPEGRAAAAEMRERWTWGHAAQRIVERMGAEADAGSR